jgi:hypothetical protein
MKHALLALAICLTGGIGFAQQSAPPAAGTSYTLWSASAVPATLAFGDPTPNELGVKFYSDSSGFITAIRFYKAPQNTGVHIAHLWDLNGNLLSSATFTNETASGWQQVMLPNPVPITAGSVYVASYWDPNGNYSLNRPYFTSQYNNPPLHALADGANGANGVYMYNSSSFPISTYQSSNYWVDVVFTPNTSPSASQKESAGPSGSESVSSPTVSSISPAVGPASGGAQVTINGSNFQNGATVSFGGVNATSVSFVNPTELEVVAPAGAEGNATVEVANPDGGTAELPNAFAYNQGPSVTGISPASGPATGGTTVTITGSGFENGAMVSFGVTPATSVTVVSPTEIQAVVPPEAAGAAAVTVTNTDSTVGTLASAFTFLANVVTPPAASSGALLTGMTPSNYTLPSGWTLVTTDNFESGSLPAGQSFYGGSNPETIDCSFAHTGSCSLDTYVTHSYGGLGLVINGNYINSRETYVSFWQYTAWSNAGGPEYTDWYITNRLDPISRDSLTPNWQVPGGFGCSFACNPSSISFFQSNPSTSTGPAPWAIYGGSWNEGLNQWVQYEVHLRVNDPGTDNGRMDIYQNGQLMLSVYKGAPGINTSRCPVFNGQNDCGYFVGNQDFTNADLWIPGDWGVVGVGSFPPFSVYTDDVIVLKK